MIKKKKGEMEHSYLFFDPWYFKKASILKSKDFCLLGDKLIVVHWDPNLRTDKKREKKKRQRKLFPFPPSLGGLCYSVPLLVEGK